jgi:hypothetical protein
MDRISYYLQVPKAYCRWLGGLRWAYTQEAVEYEDVGTFAFAPEVALFLEGLASVGPLIHFGQVLHLLHLLGYGRVAPPLEALPLARAFKAAGRPARNAGVLCAHLCRAIPPVPDAPNVAEMCRLLSSGVPMPLLSRSWVARAYPESEEVPLSHAAFEREVLQELKSFSPANLEAWLRHGHGSVTGEQIAQELTAIRPRSLQGALAALVQNPRLAGAIPYVAQLVSALALPPRRLDEEGLPMGGYADVCTRGQPERILPSQFAMDELEFLRRFAAHELLYFRREEPLAQTREELVVVLDQGVRTWGVVRLLLSAAALALGKLAVRKKLTLYLTGTSAAGELLDPVQADDQVVGHLVEASDFTANPAVALERLLQEPTEAARDVVLLTHPRNLVEPAVAAAGRRAGKSTRLFGVAADAGGRVQLSELKNGTPVKVSQFQIELAEEAPPEPSRPPRGRQVAGEPRPPWKGDIEPVGFPFRFGTTSRIEERLFDFDHAGEWLLVVCQRGMLHAFRIDGSAAETLPRAIFKNKLLTDVAAINGVAGGFVVFGFIDQRLLAVHYDFLGRRCRVYEVGPLDRQSTWRTFYLREFHSVVVRFNSFTWAMDLATGSTHSEPTGTKIAGRATGAYAAAQNYVVAPPWMRVNPPKDLRKHRGGPTLHLDEPTGMLTLEQVQPSWPPFIPLSDGKPLLAGRSILRAQCQGTTLALTSFPRDRKGELSLHLFRGPEGRPFYERSHTSDFMLSSDGCLLVSVPNRRASRATVQDLTRDCVVCFATPRGRFHSGLDVELGDSWMAIQIGKRRHLLCWADGPLELSRGRLDQTIIVKSSSRATSKAQAASAFPYDPKRWVQSVTRNVTVVVSVYGELAVLDLRNRLFCMFYVFREQIAAWMPSGVRYGPPSITGGPETPGALEIIGKALRQVCEEGCY